MTLVSSPWCRYFHFYMVISNLFIDWSWYIFSCDEIDIAIRLWLKLFAIDVWLSVSVSVSIIYLKRASFRLYSLNWCCHLQIQYFSNMQHLECMLYLYINAYILFEIEARFPRWVSKAISMVKLMLTFILQLEKRSARIAMLLDTIMFMNLCEAYEILPRRVPFES